MWNQKKNQYTQHFIISQSKGHFRYNENVNEQTDGWTDINNVGLQARRQVKKMHLQHTCWIQLDIGIMASCTITAAQRIKLVFVIT